MPQHYRARQARTRHRSVRRLYATSNQLSHHFLASRRTAHSNLRHRQECLCHHLSTAARSQILGAYHDIVLFFASAVSDSRGTACRARTRHMHARAIHAPCRYKRFASEFLHRDEWRDAAKFLCRARHAVPLLKSHLARRFFVAPASSRPFCLSLCTKRNARSAAKRKFKNAGTRPVRAHKKPLRYERTPRSFVAQALLSVRRCYDAILSILASAPHRTECTQEDRLKPTQQLHLSRVTDHLSLIARNPHSPPITSSRRKTCRTFAVVTT